MQNITSKGEKIMTNEVTQIKEQIIRGIKANKKVKLEALGKDSVEKQQKA